MDTMRIWALMALLVTIGFATGEVAAEDAEFDFRFDEPSDITSKYTSLYERFTFVLL